MNHIPMSVTYVTLLYLSNASISFMLVKRNWFLFKYYHESFVKQEMENDYHLE